MKILGGHLKGKNFYMRAGIRPTLNLTRKAVFDLLGQDMTGLSFLDLYAGSGAVGMEAASLGAHRVVFVEKDPRCLETLREKIEIQGLGRQLVPGVGGLFRPSRPAVSPAPGRAVPGMEELRLEVRGEDALAAIKQFSRRNERFDLVFADPPYERGLAKKTLKTLGAYDILQPNSHVVIESGKREYLTDAEEGFSRIRHRQYGKSWLSIYQRQGA